MRTISVIRSLRAPCVVQVLLPWMRQPPSTFSARVRIEPRSEPTSGSVKLAVGISAPLAISGSSRAFCAGVPLRSISSAAISVRVPSDPNPM